MVGGAGVLKKGELPLFAVGEEMMAYNAAMAWRRVPTGRCIVWLLRAKGYFSAFASLAILKSEEGRWQ